MSDFRITYTNADGSVSVVVPAPGITQEQAVKAVPAGLPYDVVHMSEIPSDRTFRNAWKKEGRDCKVDVTKAKGICHEHRRAKRQEEFAPHDEIIAKQIPGKSAQDAEAARVAIRAKYDQIQLDIDAATTEQELKDILAAM